MKQPYINKTFLIILLGILAALGPFTIDMYLPGFKNIAEDLLTDEKHVTFTLTSYFFGIAVGQLVYGPIVDKYGRKKPLIVGLLIYILAALGCAWSFNIDMMIVMRLMQALGGCVGMVASNAIISDVYEVDKRAKAFSSVMLIMGVAPLIAPSIGSIFVVHFSWNYIFYFLATFAFLVVLMIYFFLPETSKYIHTEKLKISKIATDYYEVLQNKTFLLYTIGGSLSMSILFAYISSAAYVFITVYELDKVTFSTIFAINTTALIIGNYLNGALTKYVHYIKIANRASIAMSIISLIVVIVFYLSDNFSYQWVIAGLYMILFTVGFINANATAASLAPFKGNAGVASALGGAIRMGIGAMVAASIGIFQANSALTMFLTMSGLSVLTMLVLLTVRKKV